MSFFLDIRLPIGLRVQANFKEQFSGTIKTLLGEVLKDLEDNSSKHYQYFLRERLSQKEKKLLRVILQEVQEEHQTKVGVSMEAIKEIPEIDLTPYLKRYSND